MQKGCPMPEDLVYISRMEKVSERERPVDDRGGSAAAMKAIIARLPDKLVARLQGGADLEDLVWEHMQERCTLWWKLHDLLEYSDQWAPRGGWVADRKRRTVSKKG